MREKVINTIEKYKMLSKGDKVIIGLSGGPDSTALIHILSTLRDLYNIDLFAVHINHMIRGKEAVRDEEYAKSLAESFSIPFYLKRVDVLKVAKEMKMSTEEAGRIIRYNFFDEIAKKVNANKVALAHNMNDQAETMIMRFIRGSGISGLSGINPIRDEKYIRPLIECTRDEIEEYCSNKGLNPMIDSTNMESIYVRNRIRLEVIPYIKKYFNPNIIESLHRASEVIRDEDDYLKEEALKYIKDITFKDGYKIEKFNKLHIALKRRIIRLLINKVKGNLNGIEGVHIEECIKLIENKETGKYICLPDDIECVLEYELFKIRKKIKLNRYEFNLKVPGTIFLEEGIKICTQVMDKSVRTYKDTMFIKYFDYDKIKGGLVVRTRSEGDFMYPKGMNGRKKIKDIFIDKKVPRDMRDKIPVIALGSEILWIIGIRDTKNYKVDENTSRVLEIKVIRSENYE